MLCPKCFKQLHFKNRCFKCENNHSYDVSKEGYVNLLLSKTNSGDNIELVKGRINFLSRGFYLPLVKEIINILTNNFKNEFFKICDCGCGTGYYSKHLKEEIENATLIGIDISKDAIKHCAKNDKSSLYIVASNQKIPFEDSYFDCLLHIFSPIFQKEAKRLLNDRGILILVTPGVKHLYELKEMLYPNPYYNKIDDEILNDFTKVSSKILEYKIDVTLNDFLNLIKMTPYYYKTKKSDIEKITFTGTISITIEFIISVFSPLKQ